MRDQFHVTQHQSNIGEQFGEPHIIEGIAGINDDDFVEAPSITRDGKTLYYRKRGENPSCFARGI